MADLFGDWACYGYEESDAGMYSGDYSIVHTADGLLFECDKQVFD